MKTAIKTAVAELLPILVVRSPDSDFSPGDRMADADGKSGYIPIILDVAISYCLFLKKLVIWLDGRISMKENLDPQSSPQNAMTLSRS